MRLFLGYTTASHFYSLGLFIVPSTKGPTAPSRKRKKKVVTFLRAERRKKSDGKRRGLQRRGYLAGKTGREVVPQAKLGWIFIN